MHVSEVAGARVVWPLHHRIAHCPFFGAPWSLGARFRVRLGTYRGRGAKARFRWQGDCFLVAASGVWVLRGCRVSALWLRCALVLYPARWRHGTLSQGVVYFAQRAGRHATPSPLLCGGGSIPYPGRDWSAAVSGCEGTPF